MHPQHLSPTQFESLNADYAPRVRMRAHRCPQATVLAISGDVDAANGERIQDFTTRFVVVEGPLILDLSGVDFFGARGISILIAVRDTRESAAVPWALVPSRSVSRVLHVTAYDTAFPSAGSLRDALRLIADVDSSVR